MAIQEFKNRAMEEFTPLPGGSTGCCCNCHSIPMERMAEVSRSEAQQLLGQLSEMLPRLERSLSG